MMPYERNQKLLTVIDSGSKKEILAAIAVRNEITPEEAHAEITDVEAECVLDYLAEPYRSATSVLMQRHGIRR